MVSRIARRFVIMIAWLSMFFLLPKRGAMSWGFLRVFGLPPQNQHRFIASVWTCEIVRIRNELRGVLPIVTPLKKLLFWPRLTPYFLFRVKRGFFNPVSYSAKGCSHDQPISISHLAKKGCNDLDSLARDRLSATE